MTKVECVEITCAHNSDGFCTKEFITLLDMFDAGTLTCTSLAHEEADNDTEEKD